MTFECDGCGLQNEDESVLEQHVIEEATLANGDFKDPSEIKCWGIFTVGSEAWKDYHEKGIHPMTRVMDEVVIPAYVEYGIAQMEHNGN